MYIDKFRNIKYRATEKYKCIPKVKKIMFAVMLIAVLFFIIKSMDKRITGVEWFRKQEYYVTILKEYTVSLDNVTSLYINDNITANDYYNHMTVLRQELDIILASYENDKKNNPVKAGTHDYYTKLGCEAVENSFDEISDLVDYCLEKSIIADKDKLIYIYLAYSQDIKTNMADYMLSYTIINYDINNGGTDNE